MLTLRDIIPSLSMWYWYEALSLTDAYFHIAITPAYIKYLQFCVGADCFQFLVLPFGLSTVPRVFTKCLLVVAAYLRHKGILIYPYVDDWLLQASFLQTPSNVVQYMYNLLQSLGLLINWEKSLL